MNRCEICKENPATEVILTGIQFGYLLLCHRCAELLKASEKERLIEEVKKILKE
jgi:hypothetical protein